MVMPEADPPPSGGDTGQTSYAVVTDLRPSTTRVDSPEKTKEDARKTIAQRLVLAYVILLAFSVIIPMVLLWIPHIGTNGLTISDARDLMLAMSGTLSGLVGILGFVMGYYFKELDKSADVPAQSGKPEKG